MFVRTQQRDAQMNKVWKACWRIDKVCMCAYRRRPHFILSVGCLCELFSHHFEHTRTHNTVREEFLQLRKSLELLVRLANFSTFDGVRRIFFNHKQTRNIDRSCKISMHKNNRMYRSDVFSAHCSGTHRMLISCHNNIIVCMFEETATQCNYIRS